MAETLLQISGLRSGYGRIPILHGIDLELRQGECLGILGHNGMGKSTLLRTIAGHIPATGGTILLGGKDVTKASPAFRARAGLGLIPQGRQIFAQLTVRENLAVGAHQASPGEAIRIIDEVVEDLPRLKPILTREGGVLSGGEQQILALGRCLCARPKLILMDEPTEGIQPSIIEEIRDTLRRLARARNLSVLLVEQNLEFMLGLTDRMQIIQRGELSHAVPTNAFRDSGLAQEFDLQATGY
ncbi:ABC transporter ATP-binding protein [Paracoccus sp. MBLB3053]|uniref:ABC transporter ATP-binding protein n=1 Tax=Paracoccus aurantius TaxID=3073814 RepID=A0ABU2HTV2_9RHOB|nr:ABC transporter ATP-binding protein [Paracoccus sp. MBLB3053]MDS9468483.1 ABC transporter ATP-binding protein [Paracoccus sp. MBLB3053]